MGRGNFYNYAGVQYYVDYPDETEDVSLMIEDLQYVLVNAAKEKGFWECNEWERGGDIHYFCEHYLMKIGFADNQHSIAICFSPRVTQKEYFDQRAKPFIKYFLTKLMEEGYELNGRCGAWTSATISSIDEAMERFCDLSEPAYG